MEECVHENENLSIIDLSKRIFRCNDCNGDLYMIYMNIPDQELTERFPLINP